MRVMIRQVFDIPQYGWRVTVYYAVTGYNVRRIMQELERLGCGGDDLERAYRNLTSGERNTGITYSNTEKRRTLVVIGKTSSAAQFQNSLDHEKGHLCRHISQAFGIDPYGEDAEYLAGYVGQRMFEVAKMFICDTCREKLMKTITAPV